MAGRTMFQYNSNTRIQPILNTTRHMSQVGSIELIIIAASVHTAIQKKDISSQNKDHATTYLYS
jgi:hypothetical protein